MSLPTHIKAVALILAMGVPLLAKAGAISREAWSFDRSQIEWDKPADAEIQKKAGTLKSLAGWVEYDFEIKDAGWYEMWAKGIAADWEHDVFVDDRQMLALGSSDPKRDVEGKDWFKEANVYLAQGRHTVRFRRLNHPGGLPSGWELRSSNGDPAGSIRVVAGAGQAVRTESKVTLKIEGGAPQPTAYELVARDEANDEILPLGKVEFPAASTPIEKSVDVEFPRQGVFEVLARADGRLLRPADLKAGSFAVVDTKHAPAPAAELKTTTIVDIDCTAAPPAQGFWEKDGKTVVKESSAGRYRESSGQGSATHWGTDGFSYQFDLPGADRLYRLRVDYPDDDRRSMGFWLNDGANVSGNYLGVSNGGGVETGDHYPLTGKMRTYEAFFYPRKDKDLIVAILNLVPGMKAAAARIRIDRVDSALPAAPLGETRGRAMGFYFEENGRWLRFFGGSSREVSDEFKTLDRWGQWNRYIGANLMFPTVNVYQNNHFPSRILEGYFLTSFNETRLAALMAEKYNCRFVPEFHLSGQRWFDKYVMGVWAEKVGIGPLQGFKVSFASKEAENRIARDCNGGYQFGVKPFGYNALNPDVQKMYIDVLGELADMLGDCESFEGISSRMMLSWQYQGWNTVNNLTWGYDDWTISEFTKDTGIAVPGQADSPRRFRERFDFLTGPALDKWLAWRCARIFDFHKRLLARIKKAKPTAKLFLTYTRTDPRLLFSPDMRDQLLHAGVDVRLYKDEPDIVIMPTAGFGRRYSTPIGDAEVLETINHPGVKAVAGSGDRGICLFSNYYEVNLHLDWSKLGGKPYAAFDACIPSGENERELYAMAMADSDCTYIATGGNGWIFGNPDVMQPFLREYRSLPTNPFTRFAKATDPVAVWQYRDPKGELWFYAVNRLPATVNVAMKMAPGASVWQAPGGDEIVLKDGGFSFALEPFMMRAFRAKGDLADCEVKVPDEFLDGLKEKIAGAKTFRENLAARRIVPEMTSQEIALALSQLDDAISSFSAGKFGAAYRELERLALVRVQYASGRYLPGVLQRSQPLGVANFSDAVPAGFQLSQGTLAGQLDTPRSLSYDEKGNLWVGVRYGAKEFSPDGKWLRNLSLFEPFSFDRKEKFDRGDIREAALYPPVPFTPSALATAPDGRLIGQQGGSAPVIFSADDGRALRLDLCDRLNVSPPCVMLAVTKSGETLVSNITGVNEYSPSGTWVRKISDVAATAAALDGLGNIYLAGSDGVRALDAKGRQTALIGETGVSNLVASEDGRMLLLTTDKGHSVTGYFLEAGAFKKAWKQQLSSAISAMCRAPQGGVTIGFASPADNVIVRNYVLSPEGLKPQGDLIRSESKKLAFDVRTPLRALGGEIYFLSGGKIAALTSGAIAFDPKFTDTKTSVESFAFAPSGDLYLLTTGGNPARAIFVCKKTGSGWAAPEMLGGGKLPFDLVDGEVDDIAVDARGGVIVRLRDPADAMGVSLFRWSPDQPSKKLLAMGAPIVSSGEYGLHVGADGSLFVTGGNTRGIWHLSPEGEVIWKTVRQKTTPPGYTDLRCPLGITTDAKGNVWVTDPTRHQVLKFDKDGKLVKTMGSFGDGTDPARLSLNQPSGIAVVDGWLYVADTGNRRIVKWPLKNDE